MKVAVFGTMVSRDFVPVLNDFFEFLKKNRIEVQIFRPFYDFLVKELEAEPYYTSFFYSHSDFDNANSYIFSVGGDGTFLQAVVNIRNFDIPVVGVNSGRLGFLADISEDQVQVALENIFNRNYSIVQRTMLEVDFGDQQNLDFNFALNEVTVLKTDTSSMINVLATLDKELLNNYWADGLIVATPTGSTAYSLSVGGPILTPDSENFVITPSVPLDLDTVIKVKKANFKLKTLQLPDQTFFNTLRNKLMWGMDKRN